MKYCVAAIVKFLIVLILAIILLTELDNESLEIKENKYAAQADSREVNGATIEDALQEDRCLSVAHRGYYAHTPENTIEAIIEAKKNGFDFVEVDVNKTKDGEYILMHDTTVDRTTNGTGKVSDLCLCDIESLNIDNLVYDKEKIYKVPLFEDVVKVCRDYGIGINIDCSKISFNNEDIINEVMDIVDENSMEDKVFFVISDDSSRKLLNTLYPSVCITKLCSSDTDKEATINEFVDYDNKFITYPINDVSEELINEYKMKGIKTFIYGCDSTCKIKKAIEMGAKLYETDNVIYEF